MAADSGRLTLGLALSLLYGITLSPNSISEPALRGVVAVGNNWDGTVDLIDPRTFQRIRRVNVVPDRGKRMAEINPSLDWLAPRNILDIPARLRRLSHFHDIREKDGNGHDQLVDDVFPSRDGRLLYVSRPSFDDVVAIDITSGKFAWRTRVAGYRSDHAALSPDGETLLVSTTLRKVQAIDTATGRIKGEFESGDQPHESNYAPPEGKFIYHASIGRIAEDTPDQGDRFFEIVDAKSLRVLRRVDIGKKLMEFGRPGMDSAVRPMAISPNGRWVYMQISRFHGFVVYDVDQDKIVRVFDLPVAKEAQNHFLLRSAHHGIAINPEGSKLCVAGTVSDYVAIVDLRTDPYGYKIIPVGKTPYWAAASPDGRYCFVSLSGEDRVSVISFSTEKEVARIAVGEHPLRIRFGKIRLGG